MVRFVAMGPLVYARGSMLRLRILAMIVETVIVSCTAIVLGAMWLADRTLKRVDNPIANKKASIAERQRILERQRNEWMTTANDHSEARSNQVYASDQVRKIDKMLLNLAEEESNS